MEIPEDCVKNQDVVGVTLGAIEGCCRSIAAHYVKRKQLTQLDGIYDQLLSISDEIQLNGIHGQPTNMILKRVTVLEEQLRDLRQLVNPKLLSAREVSTIQIFGDGADDVLLGCAYKFEKAGYQVQFAPPDGAPALWFGHYEVCGQDAIVAFAEYVSSQKSLIDFLLERRSSNEN